MNSMGTTAKRFSAIFALMLLLGLGAQSAEQALHGKPVVQTANIPDHDPEWG
ncbi:MULTISPECIES: hypothetical protein [unclassified Streptomyces]|uniref:hypothetical protein n=1 Tax=unclassified Streptomyces TaxID=2593676 RepID=UPI0011ACC5A4|nr:hypothetical protein [Streptomyces sp. BK340]TVZ80468.1 hypothetical protein FB157_12954 [Streptomyces sp. BK340]